MKIFNNAIFPLALALVLGGALPAMMDYSTLDSRPYTLRHTATWGSRSFDEALWLAVDEIADIEDGLPQEIENFHVVVQSTDEAMTEIHMHFDRASLAKLMAGEIAPANWIRDYVEFN